MSLRPISTPQPSVGLNGNFISLLSFLLNPSSKDQEQFTIQCSKMQSVQASGNQTWGPVQLGKGGLLSSDSKLKAGP